MRMRPQLPMFTTSETAPMVQKLVRLATAPKTNARMKPPRTTAKAGWPKPAILPSVPRGIGDARGREALAAQPARIAAPARPSLGIGVVARHGEREIHAPLRALADDLRLGHAHERRLDGEAMPLDRSPGREVRHALEGVQVFGAAIGIARIVDRVGPGEDGIGFE